MLRTWGVTLCNGGNVAVARFWKLDVFEWSLILGTVVVLVLGGFLATNNQNPSVDTGAVPAFSPAPPAVAAFAPTLPVRDGIWISREELARLPMTGPAWDRVKRAADGPLGGPATVADYVTKHDTTTLAVALVYGRTEDPAYRKKAADAISSVVDTEKSGLAVMVSRNIVGYVIAADLIDFAEYDPAREALFRAWISRVREEPFPDRTMRENDELRTNNHGRVAGAARAAIDVYLGDQRDLTSTALVFKGFLGDRKAYDGFEYRYSLSWQDDQTKPIGINPPGATREGHDISGSLPEEMRRGCDFQWPPCVTGYPWEAMGGVLVEAQILSRQGYDVWEWEDRAIRRASQFLADLNTTYGDWWAAGDDTWQPWLIDDIYGTTFRLDPAVSGKNMGWTDWTNGPRLP